MAGRHQGPDLFNDGRGCFEVIWQSPPWFGEPTNIDPTNIHPANIMAML